MGINFAIVHYMHEKLKSWLADDTLYIAILLILVSVASFGLGRQSMGEGSIAAVSSPVKVQLVASSTFLVPKNTASSAPTGVGNGAAVITAPVPKAASTGSYVASKSGSKYYKTTCSGAKRIKEANKVYFASVEEAAAAGYSPAANCN